MSENSKGSEKEYTVDEILAEFDHKHKSKAVSDASAENENTEQFPAEPQNEIKDNTNITNSENTYENSVENTSDPTEESEQPADSSTDEPDDDSNTEDPEEDSNTEGSEEENESEVSAAETKTEPVIPGVTPAEIYNVSAEERSAEELFSAPKAEEKEEEIRQTLAAEAVNAWNDIPDTGENNEIPKAPEEVKEEIVPPEEREAALRSGAPDTDPKIIYAEEEKENTSEAGTAALATENTDKNPEAVPKKQENTSEDRSTALTAENADTNSEAFPEKEEKENASEENNSENAKEESESSDETPNSTSETPSTDASIAENGQETEKSENSSFIRGIIPWKGDSVFEIIRKIIFIVALAVFIGAGIMLISTLVQSRRALSDLEEIKEVVTTTVATTVDSDGNVVTIAPTKEEEEKHNFDIMQYYKDISENVVGFIELEGCDIYQPVVQGDDNDYYLKHTYYDEVNKGGSIFADYRCRIEDDYMSPNIVLYGHNQEDGTMFGNLKKYKQDLEFYAANPTITFRTDSGAGIYLIYGFFVTNALENQDSNGEVFHYHDYIEVMNDESTFNWYLGEVQKRNQIISPVDVEYGDQLLCLSTCSNEFSNSRFVVFARKLRDGETVSDYDFTEAYFNPNAQGVDWEAIMSGETTTESSLESEEETTEETSEETTEETTEDTTEETTFVPETEETTTAPETTTEETSKTKRVDRTKTSYVSTENLPETSDSEEESATTEVPVTEDSETTTETAGITQISQLIKK